MGTIILSALVAHTGWHWMLERWDRLRQFRFQWPELDAALLASGMRWAMWLLIAGGAVWLLRFVVRIRAIDRNPIQYKLSARAKGK
jgi:TRAP-type C4-dicarboxylate transport system permease small subunit